MKLFEILKSATIGTDIKAKIIIVVLVCKNCLSQFFQSRQYPSKQLKERSIHQRFGNTSN